MPQFGTGPELAAQCQPVSPPTGWRPWGDQDGPIPDGLRTRATAMAGNSSLPLGTTENYPLPGVIALIRIEPRIWTRTDKGDFTSGCFRVGAVFLPSTLPAPAAPITPPATTSKLRKVVGILTVASLVVGTVATLVTMEGKR